MQTLIVVIILFAACAYSAWRIGKTIRRGKNQCTQCNGCQCAGCCGQRKLA